MLPSHCRSSTTRPRCFSTRTQPTRITIGLSEYTRQSIKLFQISGEPMQLRRLENNQERNGCRPAKFPRMISVIELGTTSATAQGNARSQISHETSKSTPCCCLHPTR